MYTLYTDKSEDFKCNIGVEGASISNTTARLVLENKNVNLMFEGKVSKDGTCTIPIKKLKNILPEGTEGKMILEVVADDSFFSPWDDDFSVKVNKRVTVEVANDTRKTIKENKVQVKVSGLDKPKPTIRKAVVNKPKLSHSEMIGEVLTKKGVTLDNFDSHVDSVQKLVETYIKKYKIKESADNLLNEIIINLK